MAIHTTGNSVSLTAQEHRNQTATMLPPFKAALGVRGGVHSGLAMSKTSGMGFSLTAGRAVVEPAAPASGPYVFTSDSTVTMSFDPGDAARPRIDVVAIKINESAGVEDAGSFVILKGAYPSSGNPVTPNIPDSHEALWSVLIPAGASAGNGGWSTTNRTDLRRNLVTLGSPIPVNSTSERNSLAVYEGMQVMRMDLDGSIDRYVNGRWRGNTAWVNLLMEPGWEAAADFTKMRVKLTADGNIAMLAGEVWWRGAAAASEGQIIGRIPAWAMEAGIVPEERSFVPATDDNFAGTFVLTITPNGFVRLGPHPNGRVFMFYGTFPIQNT